MSQSMDYESLIAKDIVRVITMSLPKPIVAKLENVNKTQGITKLSRKRKPKKSALWKESFVYKTILFDQADLQDFSLDNQNARLFKRRYRMEYPTFQIFMQKIRESPVFLPLFKSSRYPFSVPMELKVLATLRYLGRGQIRDDSSELSGISSEVLRTFAAEFCKLMVLAFYDSDIDVLRNGLLPQHFTYSALPGCLGCMDSTHVSWANCPATERNAFCGKHGKPTLVFSIIVDHNLQILSCSREFPGIMNDKTIVRSELLFQSMLTDPSFLSNPYNLLSLDNSGTIEQPVSRGSYLLVDGGYFENSVLMKPISYPENASEKLYSDVVSGLRKDVERVFGILKHRFRLFKNDLLCRDRGTISNMFIACCILHNFLLKNGDCYTLDRSQTSDPIGIVKDHDNDSLSEYSCDDEYKDAANDNDVMQMVDFVDCPESSPDTIIVRRNAVEDIQAFPPKKLHDQEGFRRQRAKLQNHLSLCNRLRDGESQNHGA